MSQIEQRPVDNLMGSLSNTYSIIATVRWCERPKQFKKGRGYLPALSYQAQ